jgi:hypothetical protein
VRIVVLAVPVGISQSLSPLDERTNLPNNNLFSLKKKDLNEPAMISRKNAQR